uniref:Ovule protein n=1 Tax=Taenia asiatica TaxID=60517 RepID=A0A0R3VZ00_TAEAS
LRPQLLRSTASAWKVAVTRALLRSVAILVPLRTQISSKSTLLPEIIHLFPPTNLIRVYIFVS